MTNPRQLPAQDERVETEVIRFGDEQGLFIRGKDAEHFAKRLVDAVNRGQMNGPTLALKSLLLTAATHNSEKPTPALYVPVRLLPTTKRHKQLIKSRGDKWIISNMKGNDPTNLQLFIEPCKGDLYGRWVKVTDIEVL